MIFKLYSGETFTVVDSNGNEISNCMKEITWSELKTKRDNSQLLPGMWYRITDYNTTTTQANTQSAGHRFDVLVLATSTNTLSEEARAMKHTPQDSYFTNFATSKLEAWKIWYCLDNDTERFLWADSGSTGRGVIYRMIDEWGNDCPYDFKNIMFKRPLTSGLYDIVGTDTYVYTFNMYDTFRDIIRDCSPLGNLSTESFCFKNKMATAYSSTLSNKRSLNDNVFLNVSENGEFNVKCFSNVFGDDCHGSTFGNNCYSNTFGNNCSYIVFGEDCNYNTFENNCNHVLFGYISEEEFMWLPGHYRYITVEKGNQNIYLIYDVPWGDYFQNNRLAAGLNTSVEMLTIEDTAPTPPNRDYTLTYMKDSNGHIFLHNVGDFIGCTPAELELTITPDGVDAYITVDAPQDSSGLCTLDVDGKKVNTCNITDGRANATISELSIGNHTMTFTYTGDSKYGMAQVTDTFTITGE